MYVCGRNGALDLLGTRNPLWRARSICFPDLSLGSVLGYVTSPWEHFLWILFINISKKPTNYCLASVFILFFFFFFWLAFQQGTLLLWVFSAGWGGRALGSLFGWFWLCCCLSPPFLTVWGSQWLSVLFSWPFVNYLYRQAFLGLRFSLGFAVCL